MTRLPRRRLGATLARYAAREVVAPTSIALVGLVAAVLLKDLLGYADLVVNRGLGAGAVAVIALHQLVPLVTWTLPFALLVGTLVAFGRLKADRELLAVEASGVAPVRWVTPVLAVALAATLVDLGLAGIAAPWSRRELVDSLERMLRENPGASLRAGTVLDFGDRRLLAREVSPRGDVLRGVLLWLPEFGETFFGERATVAPTPDGGLALTLEGGAILHAPTEGAQWVRFDRFHTELRQEDSPLLGSDVDRLAASTNAELARLAGDGSAPGLARLAEAERQRRLALPLATLVFGLLAVPLALAGPPLSRSAGAVVGLLATVGFYGLVQLGNGLLRIEGVPVAVAVWLPDVAGAAIALALAARLRAGAAGLRDAARGAGALAGIGRAAVARRLSLDRYVLGSFARLAALSFGALLATYLMIDVLERLEWFARHHAETGEVLRFYAVRIPLLASRIAPMALLAGSSLTVSLLGAQGELVAMESCGIRLERGLAAIPVLAALAAPLYFVLNDAIVPRTNALADRIKVEEIRGDAQGLGQAVWYRDGDRIVRADHLRRDLGEASDVTIFELDPDGFPRRRIDAPSAQQSGHGRWRLGEGARQVEITQRGLVPGPAPAEVRLGEGDGVDPMHLGVRGLRRAIRAAQADGFDATALRVDLWTRIAGPLLCLLLPAAALFFALGRGVPESPARSLLVSAGIGVGTVLASGVATSFGLGGRLPPPLASLLPPFALALGVVALARRARR